MDKPALLEAIGAVPFWYHRIDLPQGITTPGWAPINRDSYGIPDDMHGCTVLDIGAWDGYWTFEAIRRGARNVTAIEDFSDTLGNHTNADRSARWHTFKLCADAFGFEKSGWERMENDAGQSIDYFASDIQNTKLVYREYTNIFAFGLLYHLQHPFLALQNMKKFLLPGGTLHIETAILDGCRSVYSERGYTGLECSFEFYPDDQYGNNASNWYVGTLRAWCSMVQAAGFKDIECWKLTDSPKSIAEARGFIRAKG